MTLDGGSGSLRERAEATDQLIDAKMSATAPTVSIGAPPRFERRAHQDGDSSKTDQKSQCQANGEFLGPQNNDLRERHERGDGGEHDRGDAGRHALLGPEQEPVVEDEDQQGQQECRGPLAPARRALAAPEHPEIEGESRNQEAHRREEEWGNFVDADANGEKGGSPHKVDDREGRQGHPTLARCFGLHGKIPYQHSTNSSAMAIR